MKIVFFVLLVNKYVIHVPENVPVSEIISFLCDENIPAYKRDIPFLLITRRGGSQPIFSFR